MLARCNLNLYFYIFFMDHVQKKIININKKRNKTLDNFLSTHTLINHDKTFFMENSNPKM
jgi:hypothetical protein